MSALYLLLAGAGLLAIGFLVGLAVMFGREMRDAVAEDERWRKLAKESERGRVR